MYLKTQGLVLREVAYKDTDKLLTVLTRDYGKMTLKARGVRRSGSPLKASCQLLACGEFTIFEYRGMSTINEAQTVELFPPGKTTPDGELITFWYPMTCENGCARLAFMETSSALTTAL